ncbi:hypothetical protein [Desulforamulus aquiferis]|uniref:TFIIB-type domain-containing protein n=1 Tax=Desulforamulus aquiferis TaxID=1397668 RepID=A0AAW7ZCG6_9FIRM|nr:hypothetical protein [Desulforamulus aquiferis]MDO7787096.1 hypothetical protein [Desulforamulus aquiferis]
MNEINVEFTCPDCDKTFSIGTSDILEKETIFCNNCGCQLSEEELHHLKLAIRYMHDNKPN